MATLLLRSVAILHRHGARGPGDSETSSWEDDSDVIKQWKSHELENITSIGSSQMKSLGKWFGKRCLENKRTNDLQDLKVFCRFSKSTRAFESGQDFVSGYKKQLGSHITGPIEPVLYEVNADYYFRPWKVYLDVASKIKLRTKTSAEWLRKVEDNNEYLNELISLAHLKASLRNDLVAALYSTTHVHGMTECEMFWPAEERPKHPSFPHTGDRESNGSRYALTSRLTGCEISAKTRSLASWVLEERFVRSTFHVEMGGWIFLDIVQSCFDSNHNVSIFSGHDYTILGFLSCIQAISGISEPLGFGSYIILELWEVPESDGNSRRLRLIENDRPFDPNGEDEATKVNVTIAREKILKEYSMTELNSLVDVVSAALTEKCIGLPPNFRKPDFFY